MRYPQVGWLVCATRRRSTRTPPFRNVAACGRRPFAPAARRISAISSARSSVTSHASSRPSGTAPEPPSIMSRTAPHATRSPAGRYRGEFWAPTPSVVSRGLGPVLPLVVALSPVKARSA